MPQAAQSGSVRWPISLKIFGVALSLIVLMLVVSVLTTVNFRLVGQQIQLLSETYIEIDQVVGTVRSETLREVIQIERAIAARPAVDPGDEAKATELAKDPGACIPEGATDADLAARNAYQKVLREAMPDRAARRLMGYRVTRICTDRRLARALALVDAALALPQVRDEPGEIARLTTVRNGLAGAVDLRRRLHEGFVGLLAAPAAGDGRASAVTEDRIDVARGDVNRRIREVSLLVQRGTLDAAHRARALEQRTGLLVWLVTLVAGAIGLLFAWFITRNLVRPVRELVGVTTSVREGDLDVRIDVRSGDEIGVLADSFNHMVEELKQKETIKLVFGKYVDPRIVQDLLSGARAGTEAGDRRNASVFFSDLEGFTSTCEGLTPTAVVRLLNAYFSLMAEAIRGQQGVIDKYIGDSVMAFWATPFCPSGSQATMACLAALDQRARMERFNAALPELLGIRRNIPVMRVRMGIASGDVTMGSIGSDDARSFTVIGDTVNLASRLEGANKRYGTQILVDQATREQAGDAIEVREIDAIRVVGKVEATRIFELLERGGGLDPKQAALRERYEAGLARFRARQMDEALAAFQDCLGLQPGDAPSRLFVQRIQALQGQPIPDGWDGVDTLSTK